MKKTYLLIANIIVLLFGIASAQATSISTADLDTSYGTDSYGAASHTEGIWQRLGEVNGVNDGVSWSTDGGTTFDNTDSTLTIGQDVTFRFTFWQGNNGIHPYDQLLAVFDFDQNRIWGDNEDVSANNTSWTGLSETLLYEQIDTVAPRDQTPTDLSDSRYLMFYATIHISDALFSDGDTTWLRARATCNHVDYPYVTPYGYLNQGEVEDYKFSFEAAPVPEPATMLLVGTGLVGVIGSRVRRKKK